MVVKTNTAQVRPILVGSDSRPSKGITLHYPTRDGIIGARFFELPLDRIPTNNPKYDGFILLSYKWKEKETDERDEDTIFLGVRGLHWPDICLDHALLKRFMDEVISLHGKERGIIILSYSPKTFRNLTIDRTGEEFKVKNNKRAECLFNREKVKGSNRTELKIFPFVPRGAFSVKASKCTEVIRTYLLHHTRFVDI